MRSFVSLSFLVLIFTGLLGLQTHALEHGLSEASHCEICCGQSFEISEPPAQNLSTVPPFSSSQPRLFLDAQVFLAPQFRQAPPRAPPKA